MEDERAEAGQAAPAEIGRGCDRIADQIRMSGVFYLRCLAVAGPLADRVLDIGCGQGGLLALAAQRGEVRTVAVDISRELSRRARQASASAAVQADALRLPFAPESFDLLFLTEVLEHVPDPRTCLAGSHRILKPTGRLLLSVPNRDWRRHPRYLRTRKAYQPVDDHWYRVAEVADMVASADLRIERLDGFGSILGGGLFNAALEGVLVRIAPRFRHRRKRLILLAQKGASTASQGYGDAPARRA